MIMRSILELLSEAAIDSASLFAAIIGSGYGASRKQIERKHQLIRDKLLGDSPDVEDIKKARRNFYSLLSKMKIDDLISSKGDQLRLTRRGNARIREFKNNLPVSSYRKEEDANLKIFVFDIPERHRHKRDWLRQVLVNLGFWSIQKSVFVGKSKLPQEFMEDIKSMGIIDNVDILVITKTGSLKELD